MKIEAVIICVNYSDFLEISLSKNKKHFDNIIVVTSLEDKTSEEICNKYKVKCVKTDAFYINNAKLNKGLAINVGFSFLEHKDWVVNLDADIILPDNFRNLFFNEAKDIECSYASRRYDIQTYKEWKEIEQNPDKLYNKLLYRGIGYGNFFCFNYKSLTFQNLLTKTNNLPYPYWFPNVAESDWIFRNYWSDWIFDPKLNDCPNQHNISNNDRPSIPEKLKQLSFHVIHLGETGKNESERITPKFSE
jgi:Glycosyl transferase family 2